MLNIKSMKIVPAEDLAFGQVVMLPMLKNAVGIVSQAGPDNIVIPFEGPTEAFQWFFVQSVVGNAMIFEKAQIEVDPRSYSEDFSGTGCIARIGQRLELCAEGRHNAMFPIVNELDEAPSMKAYFTDWRIVVYENDREFVLFERKAP